ncbi:hypothetical protein MYU51_007307 [Penicillium brevicompactum]|uniref:Amidase n=1 Tax=Penicillium brevicompactum TaxID=5074 RepID=UPI002540F6A0|nr:Amidase [Penicillium brevicompactum]KAJ5332305.1 Amidase [Penicillium brevicompactum]
MSSNGVTISWQERAANKRRDCANKIPEEWKIPAQLLAELEAPVLDKKNDLIRDQTIRKSGILTDRELSITEDYQVVDLISALADGSLTAVEVTLAYSKRAALAQQLVACLTETMFDEAHERALFLDDLRAQGKLAGPLHGLPISIKDNFNYKGVDSTIGMICFLDDKAPENSPLVNILLDLGAVIYVKTNVPQTMMTTDSHNNVFDRTLNPWNTTLGPGGSSGGEGALIALRGSPLGVGTDIGGSIRIPAHCCGLYGFRPSAQRIPNGGMRGCNTSGMKFVLSCAGPLSTDLNGIEKFFKSVFETRPARLDSTVLDIPWREVPVKSKLRIGVVPESSIFPLHPPIRRVLEEAVRLLEAQGHEIIHLTEAECRIVESNEIGWALFGLDQGSKKFLESTGEPPVSAMHYLMKQAGKLIGFYKQTVPDTTELDPLHKLALLNTHRAELREAYRKIWLHHDLDICIAPPAQTTAVPHDTFGLAPYTTVTNVLDYPSCIIPFGEVGPEDANESFTLTDTQLGAEYDFENLQGAPCSIQLFTPNMRDEECLQIAKQIDECLKSKK